MKEMEYRQDRNCIVLDKGEFVYMGNLYPVVMEIYKVSHGYCLPCAEEWVKKYE